MGDDPKTAGGGPTLVPTTATSLNSPPAMASGTPAMPGPPAVPGAPTMPGAPAISNGPPAMPSGPTTMPSGPPTMPGPPTIPGPPAMPSGPPAMPGDLVMATIVGDAAAAATSAPPSMPPARYVIGEEIARGGMGRVVEATDTTLGRVVALKEALSMDADALRRFAREIRITARLEHPAIVPVHDGGIGPNGAPFYVMRKISGRPLERLVLTGEKLEERLALVPHIVAASHAIAHAHERGIVHRDIKPSNILVGDLGETIVIDWGLAKVIGEADEVGLPALVDPDDQLKTRAGIVFGTPGFMAPEQLRGKQVDPRCDVYALGATLYHLLSRKPPHHAKTADEMMKAAVNAPPTPIGELVEGVPPELSTIIDKALAHDPDDRYQDARELAEDLQRFLTGKLVASHHYTATEHLKRFVRQHKVPVMAVAGALVALLVIGAVAYARVVKARDRAVAAEQVARSEKQIAEDERQRAETKANALTLSQARIVADTNPTLAVAMIKPLAAKHWREVRAIAAAARASGVAWSLPASAASVSLELSRDGRHALTAGNDGVLRLYDLDRRTARTLLDAHLEMQARFADEERRIVLWHDRKLTIVDVATGDHHDVEAPSAISDLEVVGITAYWVDRDHRLWQLDLAGAHAIQLPLDEPVRELAPSPDGRWLALAGESHLLLFDRTQPTAPPQEVTNGTTKYMAWSADGARLAALVDLGVLDIAIAPYPTIVHRQTVGERSFIAHSGTRMFTIGPTGVAIVSREDSHPRKQLLGGPVGLREARGGTMVAGSEGVIAVLSDNGDHALASPLGRITGIDASPRSPYVVATQDRRLLVWNLDELEAHQLLDQPASASFVGNGSVLAVGAELPAQWIELATGKPRALGDWPALYAVAAAPNGQSAAIVDHTRHARLIAQGREPEELTGTVDHVGFLADDTVLLGAATGTVELYEPSTHARTLLVTRREPLVDVAWSRGGAGWVVALFADGTLWRRDLANRAGSAVTLKLPDAPRGPIIVLADGSALIANGKEVRAWQANGAVETHATLPRTIRSLALLPGAGALALTEDSTAYALDLGIANTVTEIRFPVGTTHASLSADTGLIVAATEHGAFEMIDPLIGQHWTLAATGGLTYSDPQISADGAHVLGTTPTTLLVWSLDLPSTAEAMPAWLDRMTNAIADSSTGGLGWK